MMMDEDFSARPDVPRTCRRYRAVLHDEGREGTGLGLSIASGFIQAIGRSHRDLQQVRPNADRGEVVLPASSDRLPTVNLQARIEEIRNGEVVLRVESEEGVRELAETVLSSLGYTVVAAASAVEASREPTSISSFTDGRAAGSADGTARSHRNWRGRGPGLRVLVTSDYSTDILDVEGESADRQLIASLTIAYSLPSRARRAAPVALLRMPREQHRHHHPASMAPISNEPPAHRLRRVASVGIQRPGQCRGDPAASTM
jgi:hypothetical protein